MAHLKTKSFLAEEKILLDVSDSEDDLFIEKNDDKDHIKEEYSSDSDSAPDVISFKAGEEKMLSFKKNRAELIRLKKNELKKKRKELHMRNLQQKEEKKKKLQMKKVPDEILEKINDSPYIKQSKPKIHKNTFNAEEKSKEKSDVIATHGSTVFKVKVLPKEVKKQNFISEDIANFKNKMFFGSHIKRELSNRHYFMKLEKYAVNLKDFPNK